jgi:hypothetical protein
MISSHAWLAAKQRPALLWEAKWHVNPYSRNFHAQSRRYETTSGK